MTNLEQELLEARNTLSADRLDMSFGELVNMYDSEELVIDPEFQRYFRWNIYQRTRFLESILCGIPIPSIFMAEVDNGRWEIVDGLQRISSVLSFFGKLRGEDSYKENGWAMCQGDIVKKLKDKKVDDLPLKFQLNIKRSSVRVEVIKWDSRYDMRYELFNRLNTGGSPLTEQEVRNCIFRGSGNELANEIRELAQKEDLISLVRPTERQKSQLYLDELVVRFYALLWSEEPKRNLGNHLTEYMRKASSAPSLFQGNKKLFIRTLKVVKNTNMKNVFQGGNYQFSPSRYDGIMMGIASRIDSFEKDPQKAKGKIEQLVKDKDFLSATGVGSNYQTRVKKRIKRAKEIF
ncbi:MAG: DUF262 domain-containing protein [Candidatus Electrothrix sp. AR3]|nr:DUF262 domain-containing protein [Candidatus Electrothrix sp. AR3]